MSDKTPRRKEKVGHRFKQLLYEANCRELALIGPWRLIQMMFQNNYGRAF